MEKSALIFVSPDHSPRGGTRPRTLDRRDAARAADRLYILSRVDGGLYDATLLVDHTRMCGGGRYRHSLAPGHAHSGSPRRHGSQHTSAAIPSWPALNRQRRPDSKCE